ncbi:Tubby [Macleaya cordata]|uniref:Tubby n=1 Tax=Macleaya cordata TaxID=56857 RepID=A0A200R2B1_MACCD|nr:Tubby [Macleaya cordata]
MLSFLSTVRDIIDGFDQCLSKQSFEVISWLLPRRQMGEHSHEHGAVDDDQLHNYHLIPPIVIDDHDQQSQWASLPIEVLHDVIIRLEERDSSWPSRKHVVACASVCKSWMVMCKEIVKTSPELHAQWRSLFSKYETTKKILKQPGPLDSTISCRIYCDKTKSHFHLLVFGYDNRFILSAKRERRTTCTEYGIYMHPIGDDMLGQNSTYMGKLSSNFLGTEFEIYDTHEPLYSTGPMVSTEVVPNAASNRIAQVVYDLNIRSPSHPRQFSNIAFVGLGDQENGQSEERTLAPLILRPKVPTWIDKLNFYHWKGTIYYENCFQLTATPSQSQQPAAPPPPDHHDHGKINISEFCKTRHFAGSRREFFTVEYSYPFSTFLAFAICLSRFGTL